MQVNQQESLINYNATPIKLKKNEFVINPEDRAQLLKDALRDFNISQILGEKLSTTIVIDKLTEERKNAIKETLKAEIVSRPGKTQQQIEAYCNDEQNIVKAMTYQDYADACSLIMREKNVPEKHVSYFAPLMFFLANKENTDPFSFTTRTTMLLGGDVDIIIAPKRSIELVENNGKYNVEYTMSWRIRDDMESEGQPIANLEVKYTFSQDRTMQLSMGIDNLEYKDLLEEFFVTLTRTGYADPENKKDPHNLLGLILAIKNDYLSSHMLRNKLDVATLEEQIKKVEGSLSPSAQAKLKEKVQEIKGTLTQVVERIEKGLKSIEETQITKLARSIDKYGEKNNFKDTVFKTQNSDIYNALSDEAKVKIDKIGEKLSDNRNALRKIIDYLKLIFCKTLDRQTVEGLNAKPRDDEKRKIEGRKSFVEKVLESRTNSSQQISR